MFCEKHLGRDNCIHEPHELMCVLVTPVLDLAVEAGLEILSQPGNVRVLNRPDAEDNPEKIGPENSEGTARIRGGNMIHCLRGKGAVCIELGKRMSVAAKEPENKKKHCVCRGRETSRGVQDAKLG